MQDLENNIDDLFRKAADNYQIDPGNSDWDAIIPRLTGSINGLESPNRSNKKRFTVVCFTLSFLIVAGIIVISVNKNNGVILPRHDEIGKMPLPKSSNQGISVKTTHNQYSNQIKGKGRNGTINIPISAGHSEPAAEVFQLTGSADSTTPNRASPFDTFQPSLLKNDLGKNGNFVNIDSQAAKSGDAVADEGNTNKFGVSAVRNKAVKQGIYLGIMAGPTFNQVKNQGMNKPGFDVGLTVGFSISNRMCVETGASFNKKHYFTDAKYFSMDKISSTMPSQMEVLSVEGSSTVIEIPVSLKYNLFEKNKTSVFSSLGLSSYVLMKEKNNYLTMMNGTKENVTGFYKNSSRYLAAALDICLGVEKSVGNYHKNKIRIEPYLQIPLKGIGVGTLPVMSAGLHVGYTLPLH